MTVNETIFSLLREALFGNETGEGNVPIKLPVTGEKESRLFWSSVFTEAKVQAVLGIIAPVVVNHPEIPDRLRDEWSGMQKTFVIKYVQMAAGQAETCKLLQNAGIPVAVMKGTAAAIYYPIPEYRAMGDVDLLVSPADYQAAVKLLKENGYTLKEEEEHDGYHTAFLRYNTLYELHQSPAGVHRSDHGDAIAKYIQSGLDHIETNTIGKDRFPILPWKQNGMELIWHIRQHLYNGLGLRQIIDWMMFVNSVLDDKRMREYMPDLKKCGLDQLAIVVTKMSQKYLGLSHEGITWCDSADEDLCDELMEFIMGQGNFGIKALDEKTAKVLSGYGSPIVMLRKLQKVGKENWSLLKKYPILTPFAFLYGCVDALRIVFASGGIKKWIGDIGLGHKRKQLFARLYGRKRGKRK